MKRSRGRGRRPQNSHNRPFESAGPEVKIRGTAGHLYEKYQQLARDAESSGDRIAVENYHQHAEHYFRIMMASQVLPNPQQPNKGQPNANGPGEAKPNGPGEAKPNGGDQASGQGGNSAPSFSLSDENAEEGEGEKAA